MQSVFTGIYTGNAGFSIDKQVRGLGKAERFSTQNTEN